MHRCDLCKRLSQPGEKQRKVVAKYRDKTYYNHKNEAVGQGTEIAQEIAICGDCAGEKDAS